MLAYLRCAGHMLPRQMIISITSTSVRYRILSTASYASAAAAAAAAAFNVSLVSTQHGNRDSKINSKEYD